MGDIDFISWFVTGLALACRPFIGDDCSASSLDDDEPEPLDFDLERDARKDVGFDAFDAFDDDDEFEADEPGLESSLSIGIYPMFAGNV